jgi:hypothetical protein
MQAIYHAIRNFLYPVNTGPRAGREFAEGTHPYAKQLGLPAHLCQDLMDFEQRNRGHYGLLGAPELAADSAALVIPGDTRRAQTVRATLKKSLYTLARTVVTLDTVPARGTDLHAVLEAGDTKGYLRMFLFDELKIVCSKHPLTGLPKGMCVRTARIESGANPVLHVRIERFPGQAIAKRSIPLAPLGHLSLRTVRERLADSTRRLQEALADAAQWPEFAPPQVKAEPVEVRGDMSHIEGILNRAVYGTAPQPTPAAPPLPVDPMPAPLQVALREAARNTVNAGEGLQLSAGGCIVSTASDATVAPTTPEADSELLARLQRHMQDFISMYSPATQEVLAANWEQFRPQVTPA